MDGTAPGAGTWFLYLWSVSTPSTSFQSTVSSHFFRSIHNTRIERLWYDVTRGFGQKWKNFFIDLELHCGLNPVDPNHIWLLHHLFLNAINEDAQQWVQVWNNHVMRLRGTRSQSPREMYFFSFVEHGCRGIEPGNEPVDDDDEAMQDLEGYGIDWQEAEDPEILEQILEDDPDEFNVDQAYNTGGLPPRMNEVVCEPPTGPLPPEWVAILDQHLSARVNTTSRDMSVRRLVWMEALNMFNAFLAQL